MRVVPKHNPKPQNIAEYVEREKKTYSTNYSKGTKTSYISL